MVTVAKLGLGVVDITAKGVKLFLDATGAGGDVPDMRIDAPETSGPHSGDMVHAHIGEEYVGEVTEPGMLDFLFGTIPTYNERVPGMSEYAVCDKYTQGTGRKLGEPSPLEGKLN